MTVKIITDSLSDITSDLAEKLGITVVPVYVRFGEDVYRDRVEMTTEEFYRRLVHDDIFPSTTQPTPKDFSDVYDKLAKEADETIEIGAYCTVFSATEVLENIRAGRPIGGILRGLYLSMVRRVMEMDLLENRIVLTGGVAAHNPILAEILSKEAGAPVTLPPAPQITGALGAALFAKENTT